MKSKKILIIFFLLNSIFFYSLKFTINTKKEKEIIIQGIFDMGFSTKDKGSGLGLTLSKAVVDSLGGTLGVEKSVIFEGTQMYFKVPTNLTPIGDTNE